MKKMWMKRIGVGLAAALLTAGSCFLAAYGENTDENTEQEQEYIFPDSGSAEMSEEDLEGLPLQVIAYGKYEILARRGMLFSSEELQGYFEEQSWYFGFIEEAEFPDSMLDETERANLQLLKQQEEALAPEGYQTDREGYSYEAVEAYLAGEDLSALNQSPAEEESETEAETEAESESEAEAETEAESESEAETETEAESESEAEAETEAESESRTEPETETESESETEAEPDTEGAAGFEDAHGVDLINDGTEQEADRTSGGSEAEKRASGSEYIFPDVSNRYLSRSEVEALSLQAICYAKNEIYARHGRKFVSRELQEYFGSKSWYDGFVEPDDFADWVFNDYERANLDLIVSCELAIRPDGYPLDQPGYDITAVGTASPSDGGGNVSGNSGSSMEAYQNQDYIFPDSDARYLTEEEVNALTKTEAGYAYKEILARRGCIFKTQKYQDYFQGKNWYKGKIAEDDFTSDLLNKFEQYNLSLIKELKAG